MKQCKLRLLEAVLSLGLVFSGFFYLLARIQLTGEAETAEAVYPAVAGTRRIEGARGAILDRTGTALVTTETAFRVTMDESVSQEDREKLEKLRDSLGLTAGSGNVLTQEASGELLAALADWNLEGVQTEAWGKRVYHTDCAAHLLGRTGTLPSEDWEDYQALGYELDDLVGLDGLEKAFEAELRPTDGTAELLVGEDGEKLGERILEEAQPGSDLTLTLNLALQEEVEDALADCVSELEGAEGGACVVLDVSDGGVLAAASYPSYSLETFSQDYETLLQEDSAPLFNRAFQGSYAPGSVFKLVTAAAGLEEGVIDPDTELLDTGIYSYYESYQPQCWLYRQSGRTHGWETVSEALRDSCNVFFYEVGRQLGIETLDRYAAAFGLGQKTGIELTEAAGVLAGPEYSESRGEQWYGGSTLSAAIGQSDHLFTPLQLANCVATLVNGGTRYQLHLEKSLRSPDGETEEYEPVVLGQVTLQPENLAAIKEGMRLVVTEGGLQEAFADCPVTAGAKTGSVQVSGQENSNAVLVCFAPYENPEIAVAIVVENGGGGSVLGEVGERVVEKWALLG